MVSMDFIPTPKPVKIDGAYWAQDGHPNNIGRTDRYYTDQGGTICGVCAVEESETWVGRADDIHERMAQHGIERDPYDPGKDEADWCFICDADFTA